MLIKTLLNHVEGYKGFVYEDVNLVVEEGEEHILVKVRERKGTRCTCSGCGRRCAVYDHQPERRFNFVPIFGIPVFFCTPCVVRIAWNAG